LGAQNRFVIECSCEYLSQSIFVIYSSLQSNIFDKVLAICVFQTQEGQVKKKTHNGHFLGFIEKILFIIVFIIAFLACSCHIISFPSLLFNSSSRLSGIFGSNSISPFPHKIRFSIYAFISSCVFLIFWGLSFFS